MSKESIRKRLDQMREGARQIEEMRQDGRLPSDYNSNEEFRNFLLQRIEERKQRRIEADRMSGRSSLQSSNSLATGEGRSRSALGFQVRVAMFNLGASPDKPYLPPPINGDMNNLLMDLRDQAGTAYNQSNLFPEK